MPQEYRDQFDADAIASCAPEPEKMYCLPYTGFGEIMYRNLTVLEAAGIDTTTPPATWEEWHAQMVKVKEAGKFAIPDQTQVFNSVASMYAVRGDKAKWGIDFEKRQTLIEPEPMTRTMQMFIDMAPLQSGTSRNDQAHEGPVHHQPTGLSRRRSVGEPDLCSGGNRLGTEIRLRSGARRNGRRPWRHQKL